MRTHKIRLNCVPSIGVQLVTDGLKDGKSKKPSERIVFTSCIDKEGRLQRLPIDQFSGKRFLLNANGFPMNDIEAFEQCQSDSVARAVLNRLNIVHSDNLPQNLTPQEMFDRIVPVNWSSPAEYIRASKMFAEKVYKQESARRCAAAAAAEVAAQAAADKKVNTVHVDPE